jgi:predicted Zn-dependent protease
MLNTANGRLNEASVLLLQAAERNPLSTPAMSLYCWNEYLVGAFAHALDEIDQMRASGRSGPVMDAVEALSSIQLEEPNTQIERLETLATDSPHHHVLRGALGYAYAVTGQGRRASELLDALTNRNARSATREPYAVALILVGLNDREKALQWLEQSYREGSLWSLGFRSDPILEGLRNDLRYRQFLSKFSYSEPENADARWVPLTDCCDAA